MCVLEAGPTDVGSDEVLRLRRWLELLEGDYDYGYTTTLQPRGNAHIVHSRARVLGGCSSHNTQIWFKPLPLDWKDWVDQGCDGLGLRADGPVLRPHPGPARARRRRRTATRSCSTGSRPRRPAPACTTNPDWNAAPFSRRRRLPRRRLRPGDRRALVVERDVPAPDHGRARRTCRSSASRARCASRSRNGRATGGATCVRDGGVHDLHRGAQGDRRRLRARSTRRACCCYSGIGPRQATSSGSASTWSHDLPGVGENLIDHPESIIIWKLKKPMGPEGAMDADCALFVNRLQRRRAARPDVPHLPAAVHVQHGAARLRGAGRPLVHLHDAEHPALARPRPAVAAVEGPGHQAGARLPLLHGRGRLRRADDRRRPEDRPQGGRDGAVRRLDRARDRARARHHERRRAVDLRPRRAPHRLPPVGHLPDGLGGRRSGGGRPGAARARHRGPVDRGRLDLPVDDARP